MKRSCNLDSSTDMSSTMECITQELYSLVKTVQSLRGHNGCPWDKKQTTSSLKKHLIEECGEIIQAIENRDSHNLCEELGDFLYLIIMVSLINEEKQTFTLSDVARGINEKLIRRHPHVFSGTQVADETELRNQWDRIKKEEKESKNKLT